MNLKLTLPALVILTCATSAHADFWSKNFTNPAKKAGAAIAKPFEKATDWVAVRSGVKPTVDNANKATTATAAAADQTAASLKALTPKAEAALNTFNSTWPLISWSIFGVLLLVCLLLMAKVVAAWKVALGGPPSAKGPSQEARSGKPSFA